VYFVSEMAQVELRTEDECKPVVTGGGGGATRQVGGSWAVGAGGAQLRAAARLVPSL